MRRGYDKGYPLQTEGVAGQQFLQVAQPQGIGLDMPVRTCVGCRRKTEKAGLVRVVLVEGELVADLKGNQPGRGAYLCPDDKCLGKAIESGSLARTLKIKTAEEIKGFDDISNKTA